MNFVKKVWPKVKKDLFQLFGLALGITVIFLIVTAIKYPQYLRKRAAVFPNDASFTLSASQTNITPGETTTVSVFLANPNQRPVDGLDIILNFNQSILQLRNIIPDTSTNFKTFLPLDSGGVSFDVDGVISQANATGRIEFGTVTFNMTTGALTNPVRQTNVLVAQLQFEGTNAGSSLISFDFDPAREGTAGETTDSNVTRHTATLVDDFLGSTGTVTISVSSVIQTPTPTIIPTPTPTIVPTPTPTLPPTQAQLNFKIKFQGINDKKADRTTRVILKQDGLEKYRFESVGVNSDLNGVYSGSVTDIVPGTYDVFIKGWAHLQKNFGGVSLVVGENSYNWSGTELSAGDFDNDNILDIEDMALILAVYTQLTVPANEGNRIYDINASGAIDIFDISLVLTNYTQLEINGD